MREVEAAYIAGLFDGEGCVHIEKSPRLPFSPRYIVKVQIGMKSNRTLTKVKKLTRLGKIYKGKDKETWTLSGESAVEFLNIIRPFAVTKLEQIDLALEFSKLPKGPRGKRTSEEVLAERDNYYHKLKQLKREHV